MLRIANWCALGYGGSRSRGFRSTSTRGLAERESSMQRRDFLKRAAAAGALSASASLADEQPPPIPIVDTHVHLWDLNRFRLPWIRQGTPLARSHVMKDYLTAVDGLNVVKAVYMEVDVEVGQQRAEAEYVFEICRQNNTPLKAAVISGRPAERRLSQISGRIQAQPLFEGRAPGAPRRQHPGRLLPGAQLHSQCPPSGRHGS